MRDRLRVYGWVGGDKPSDVVEGARRRKEQGFGAGKGVGGSGDEGQTSMLEMKLERSVRRDMIVYLF